MHLNTGLWTTGLAAVLMVALRCAAGVLGPRLHRLPENAIATAARVATLLALGHAVLGLFQLESRAFVDATVFAVSGLCVFALCGRLPWALVGAALVWAAVKAAGA